MTLLLHPGFHKTGTTWLQSVVFAETRLFNVVLNLDEIDAVLLRPHETEFSAEVVRLQIDARRSHPASGTIDVISHEDLSGNLFTGSRDSVALADRLKSACGEAKVLLTVRNQSSLARSLYMQYVKRGGRKSLLDFLRYRPEPSYFWFTPNLLEYHRLAAIYGHRFGDDNVLVLPQEVLARDRGAYLGKLLEFASGSASKNDVDFSRAAKAGVSPPASSVQILRVANLFRKTPLNPEALSTLSFLGDLLHSAAYRFKFDANRSERKMYNKINAEFAGRFVESNAQLQRYVPFDLRQLGYEMPVSAG